MSQIDTGTQATPPCEGRTHRRWDLRNCWDFRCLQWWVPFHVIVVLVCRRQGERLMHACIPSTEGNCCPSSMAWGTIYHGERSELVVLDRASTANTTSGFSATVFFPVWWGRWDETLRMSTTMPCSIQHVTRLLVSRTAVRPRRVVTLTDIISRRGRNLLDTRGGHTRYYFCGDTTLNMFKRFTKMLSTF